MSRSRARAAERRHKLDSGPDSWGVKEGGKVERESEERAVRACGFVAACHFRPD